LVVIDSGSTCSAGSPGHNSSIDAAVGPVVIDGASTTGGARAVRTAPH